MSKPRLGLYLVGQRFGRGECVYVAAATAQPAVEVVRKGRGVGDGNEQSPIRFNHSPYLPERTVEVVEMFQAMVRDDCAEHAVREG